MLSWITIAQSSELIAQWRASDAQDAPSHPQFHISCVSGSPCYPPARGQYGYHTCKSWKRKDLLQNLGYLLLSGMRHHTQSFGKIPARKVPKNKRTLHYKFQTYVKFSQWPEDTCIPGHPKPTCLIFTSGSPCSKHHSLICRRAFNIRSEAWRPIENLGIPLDLKPRMYIKHVHRVYIYIYIYIYKTAKFISELTIFNWYGDCTTIKLWSLEWPQFLRRSQMLVGHINDSVVWRLQQAIMIWIKCHLNGLCPCFYVIKLTYLGLQLNLFKSSSTLVYQPLETRKSFTVLHLQSSTSISTGVFSWGNLWQFGGHVLDILRVELHCYHPSSQSPVLPGCPQRQRRGVTIIVKRRPINALNGISNEFQNNTTMVFNHLRHEIMRSFRHSYQCLVPRWKI